MTDKSGVVTGPISWGLAVGAGLLGLALNFLAMPILPAVHFLVGSVPALMLALTVGPRQAGLAALIASLTTYWLWGRGVAIGIFTAEAVVIGVLARRIAPLSASLVYWIVFGAPLVWLGYRFALNLSEPVVLPIMLKQVLNGWLNVLLAMLAVAMLPRLGRPLAAFGGRFARPTLQQVLLLVMVTIAVVPIFLAGGSYGRMLWSQEEVRIRTTQEEHIHAIVERTRSHVMEHQRAVGAAALMLGATTPSQAELRRVLEGVQKRFPGFVNMYVGDRNGRALAFSAPYNNLPPERLVGLDFSDRPYFRELRAGRSQIVSEVFQGRGGTTAPIVVVIEAIERGAASTGTSSAPSTSASCRQR